jgi:hypothetical protein
MSYKKAIENILEKYRMNGSVEYDISAENEKPLLKEITEFLTERGANNFLVEFGYLLDGTLNKSYRALFVTYGNNRKSFFLIKEMEVRT